MNASAAVMIGELESVDQAKFGDLFDPSVADVPESLVPYFQGSP